MIEWMNEHQALSFLLIAWSIAWKAPALWRSANLRHRYWFIAIFALGTLGILEIIYLFIVSPKYKVEVVEN